MIACWHGSDNDAGANLAVWIDDVQHVYFYVFSCCLAGGAKSAAMSSFLSAVCISFCCPDGLLALLCICLVNYQWLPS